MFFDPQNLTVSECERDAVIMTTSILTLARANEDPIASQIHQTQIFNDGHTVNNQSSQASLEGVRRLPERA